MSGRSAARSCVVTGANRGIGLSVVSELIDRGESVHATCRASSDRDDLDALARRADGRLVVNVVDVADRDDVAELGERLVGSVDRVDLLVNNAGVMTDGDTIDTIDADTLGAEFAVNALGPALVTKAFMPLLRQSRDGVVVNMSSSFASIELKRPEMPARYAYSMSKAAVNMFTKTLAAELSDSDITVVAMHPGWVQTGIGGPDAALTPAESAASIVSTIDSLTRESSGSFLTWDGRPLPW